MKKTDKPNPITFFRKANEARQAVVKKSMKKAQDGGPQRQGPLQEKASKMLDARYPSTAAVPIPYAPNEPNEVGYAPRFEGDKSSNSDKETLYRKGDEDKMRNDAAFNYGRYKRGGALKRKK
jgi:hypothetical protein